MHERDVNIHITSGSIVKTILFLILVGLLWYLRDIVLIVVTAVVIASAMEPGILAFMRWGLSRLLSVIAMYVLIGLAFFAVLFIFIPPVLDDAANFISQLPATLSTINLNDLTHGLLPGTFNTFSSVDLLHTISNTVTGSTGGAFLTLSAVFGGITSFVLIVVFSFYFSVQDTGVDDFLRVVTPAEHQAYVLNLWKRAQHKIGRWMQGQLLLGLLVGVLIFLLLTVFRIKYALLLGILAAVFELIPVFGQILAAIPAVAIGYSTGGVPEALIVVAIYVIVQQFEAHLIYPLVVKKVVGVPPILVILALLVGFKLFGFLGVLLSVPIAGAVQELAADIDKRKIRALARAGVDD